VDLKPATLGILTRTLESIVRPAVTHAGDVSLCHGDRYDDTTMQTIAGGPSKVFSVFLVSIGLLALAGLAIAIGVRIFLSAVGHYAPWEQIWAG
jgi:hypothetical protein